MSENRGYLDTACRMTAYDFEQLSTFIYNHCGIKMPPAKRTMLEARLQKRLRTRGLKSFREYCELIFESPDEGDELVQMIDAVTTNKTDFFREPVHFSILTDNILPEFIQGSTYSHQMPYNVWSSACSSGEEPYTLAIVLSEFARQNPGFTYQIRATDISTRVLEKARMGIYDESQINMIPLSVKQRYFLRSKDRNKTAVRVVPEVRASILFERLNLMDEKYPVREGSLDAIFCRNVIIYFDRPTQGTLLARLCKYLRRDGHLFLGHSETVHGFDLPLVRTSSTIYQKVA